MIIGFVLKRLSISINVHCDLSNSLCLPSSYEGSSQHGHPRQHGDPCSQPLNLSPYPAGAINLSWIQIFLTLQFRSSLMLLFLITTFVFFLHEHIIILAYSECGKYFFFVKFFLSHFMQLKTLSDHQILCVNFSPTELCVVI